jgi:predicted nucleotidyltransferase
MTGRLEEVKVPLKISPEQMAIYRATAQRRRQQKARELALRHQRAWAIAQQAGQILKEQFGAERVVAFGSVLSADRFHQRSDVDLAIWGLDEKFYYRAVSRLLDLDPTIPVDLVEAELAPPALQAIIEQEGVSV